MDKSSKPSAGDRKERYAWRPTGVANVYMRARKYYYVKMNRGKRHFVPLPEAIRAASKVAINPFVERPESLRDDGNPDRIARSRNILRTATDIFSSIDIPGVSVIWSYSGVAPEEMGKRFVTVCERAMTTTVNDIEHIESQSYSGVAVIKVYFHEGAKVEAGVAQITSICQTLLRIVPPGGRPRP